MYLTEVLQSREISFRGKWIPYIGSSLWAHPITQQCLSRGDPARRIIGKAKRHRGSISIKGLPSGTIGPRV